MLTKAVLYKIALHKIFGLPLIAYGGIITMLLFLTTATLGWLIKNGKANISLNWHFNMAKISITFALIHGLVGLLMFL